MIGTGDISITGLDLEAALAIVAIVTSSSDEVFGIDNIISCKKMPTLAAEAIFTNTIFNHVVYYDSLKTTIVFVLPINGYAPGAPSSKELSYQQVHFRKIFFRIL